MATFILIRGPPGSGKSTISKELITEMHTQTILVNTDAFMQGVKFSLITEYKFKREFFLKNALLPYLNQGINVVLEGLYGGERAINNIKNWAQAILDQKHKYLIINLTCSKTTSINRCTNRNKHITNEDFEIAEIEKWYDAYFSFQYESDLEYDTDKLSINEIIKDIAKKLSHKIQ